MRRFMGFVTCLALCGSAWAQSGTMDQVSPAGNAGFNLSASSLTWQQQVRTGLDGQLEGVTLPLQGNVGCQFNIRVRSGAAWQTSPALFDQLVTNNIGNGAQFIDMTASGISFSSGDLFVLELQGNDTGCGIQGSYNPPGYPEPLFLNGSNYSDGLWRHGFTTWVIEGGGGCNGSEFIKKAKCKVKNGAVKKAIVLANNATVGADYTCDLATGQSLTETAGSAKVKFTFKSGNAPPLGPNTATVCSDSEDFQC